MTEQEALEQSSGFYSVDGFVGHLPFRAANFLVGAGKYVFWQAGCWGYLLKRKPNEPPPSEPLKDGTASSPTKAE